MADAHEIAQKVDNAIDSKRTNRQDRDFEDWNLSEAPYQLDYNSTTKVITGVHSTDMTIISNSLRTFADEVHSKLASAEMQIAVRMAEAEGGDKRDDVGKLERLLQFAFEKGDERLISMLLPPLRDFTIWCASIRGWVAGRYLVYKSGDKVVFDLMPWDPRWVTYEVGKDGFLWVAYTTFRSKEGLKYEYKKEGSQSDGSQYENKVIDFWEFVTPEKTRNSVIYNQEFVKKPKTYKMSMPVIVMPVATRPPVTGLGSELGGYGESIFASIRGMNKSRNEFASIIATHAKILAKQPLLHYHDAGVAEIKSTVQYADGVLNLIKGKQEIQPTPMKEMSPTVVQIFNWMEERVERGSLPYTRVNAPQPQSGTLEGMVQEARNIVFNPQLRLLGTYFAEICRKLEEQMISQGIEVDVRTIQDNKYFETKITPVDLKKPHIIKVEFTTGTPASQMDKAQQAQMLRDLGLPEEWVWENILKIQDPKMLADLAAIELFEHSPKGAKKKAIEALIRLRGDEVGAESLVRELDREETQEEMALAQVAGQAEQAPPLEGF